MPEGDTIYQIAAALPGLLGPEPLEVVRVGSTPYPGLAGAPLGPVRAWGKHLLLQLSPLATLRVHLGMHGSWHVYSVGERWRRPVHRAVVELRTSRRVLVLFGPATTELIDPGRLAAHPTLAALGPDLLGADPDMREIVRRARAGRHPDLARLLLDQRVAAGVGNIHKAEALFLQRRSPFVAVADLDDDALAALFAQARRLLLANLRPGPRRTTPSGIPARFWIYRRGPRPCLRCRTPVLTVAQGSAHRRTDWCPACQPGPVAPAS